MFRRFDFFSPIFVLYLFLLFFIAPFLPDHWSNDANAIVDIADGLRDQDIDSGAFHYTALFFGMIGPFWYVLHSAIAYSLSKICDKFVEAGWSLAIVALFFIPAFLFGLVRPQKEVFVFILTVFVMKGAVGKWRSGWRDAIYILVIYSIYAVIMRQYYILIAAFFFGLTLFGRWGKSGYVGFFLFLLFVCFFIPPDILTLLQGSRDVINTLGRAVDENQRTAFVNYFLEIDGGFPFIVNYIYAFFYLNFSVLYFWDFPSLILTAYVLSCLLFFAKSISRVDSFWRHRLILFLAHFLILPIFEPDLGSYFRHLSSVFVYLIPYFFVDKYHFRD